MFNHSSEIFHIRKGDSIGQLRCEQIAEPKLQALTSLDTTARGACGFGSTGGTGVINNDDENVDVLLEIEKILADC